ncbi:MAG: histidinol-phosphatase HisJ family protein [Armatimonadetes bacterium]|nr:histidinol-phosphatase HisJ family protein [Armatimonadota bacterium]
MSIFSVIQTTNSPAVPESKTAGDSQDISSYYATDYQVHSFRSHDGKATIADQCRRADEIGLKEIGFSEHKDFDPFDPVVDHFNYERYMAEIQLARKEFEGKLIIRAGVEVDYQVWFEEKIAEYLNDYPFDFVIGSVHYVCRQMLMTPRYLKTRTQETAYRDYYREVLYSVQSGLIDIVGHLEYANRRGVPQFGRFDPSPYEEDLRQLFNEMIQRNVALEINSAGIRQGVEMTYPCERTVAIYAACGGKQVTFGSDAHHPDDLAKDIRRAFELAQKYGLQQVTLFENRRRSTRRLLLAG